MPELDHLILNVNDVARSVAFYTAILGFADDGKDGPFSIIRVGPTTTLQLAQRATRGGEHLAFALTRAEFDATLERLRAAGIPCGDAFDTVGRSTGLGDEAGARGRGPTLYFFDPDEHLLEIRHYGD